MKLPMTGRVRAECAHFLLVAVWLTSGCGRISSSSDGELIGFATPTAGVVGQVGPTLAPVLTTSPDLKPIERVEMVRRDLISGCVDGGGDACPAALTVGQACTQEGQLCVFEADDSCYDRSECVFGLWTALPTRCSGPAVLWSEVEAVLDPPSDMVAPVVPIDPVPQTDLEGTGGQDGGVVAVSRDGGVTEELPHDSGLGVASDAEVAQAPSEAPILPSGNDEGDDSVDSAVATSVDGGPPVDATTGSAQDPQVPPGSPAGLTQCPELMPVWGSPCDVFEVACLYSADEGRTIQQALCTCGIWYEVRVQ